MSYNVLARKWRPNSFTNLVGQNHVVKALTYALDNDKVHHAYLFTGTRGVGKTSIGRIFAKSLNCSVNGVSSTPCCKCETCLEIDAGKYVDLIEVDAASRTGVDETRELIDSVSYLPAKGHYKIYLIDEVHMFSKSSFNALLKTLEEPPPYVKFILATTDPEKLPITILSRCLQFNLKSLTENQIVKHLKYICAEENFVYDEDALLKIASAGDGSMRDTLSIMDQAVAYGSGQLNIDSVIELLGTVHPSDVIQIMQAILQNNSNDLHESMRKLDDYDVDARKLLLDLMQLLQKLAWHKAGVTSQVPEKLIQQLDNISTPLLQLWYDILRKGVDEVGKVSDKQTAMEMTLLRMLAFIPEEQRINSAITQHVDKTDDKPDYSSGFNPEIEPEKAVVFDNALVDNLPDDLENNTQTINENLAEKLAIKEKQEINTEVTEAPIIEQEINTEVTEAPVIEQEINTEVIEIPVIEQQINADEIVTEKPAEIIFDLIKTVEVKSSLEESEADFFGDNLAIAENIAEESTPAIKKHFFDVVTENEENISEKITSKDDNFNDVAESAQNLVIPSEVVENIIDNSDELSNKAVEIQIENKEIDSDLLTKSVEAEVVENVEDTTQKGKAEAINTQQFEWLTLFDKLSLTPFTRAFAGSGDLVLSNNQAILTIPPQNEVLKSEESVEELEKELNNCLGTSYSLIVEIGEVANAPLQIAMQQQNMQEANAKNNFLEHDFVKYLINDLDAKVIESTIKIKQ